MPERASLAFVGRQRWPVCEGAQYGGGRHLVTVCVPMGIGGMFEPLAIRRIGGDEMRFHVNYLEAARLRLGNDSAAHSSEIARLCRGQRSGIVDLGTRGIDEDNDVARRETRRLRKRAQEPVNDAMPFLDARGGGIGLGGSPCAPG